MRVALVHSFYHPRVPGGENAVVRDEAQALMDAGHEVAVIGAHTEQLEQQRGYALRAAVTVATGRGPSPEQELVGFRPDVVHVHNTFPNWGTSWLRRWEGPIVHTLHNFRPLCAKSVLYRDGRPCTECLDGSSLAALRHRCYRDSAAATLPLAVASSRAGDNRLLHRSDRIIVMSDRMASIYAREGVSESVMRVKGNFLPRRLEPKGSTLREPSGRWLFAGQLIDEKGVVDLLKCWPPELSLDVVGTGPQLEQVAHLAEGLPDVQLLGRLPRDELLGRMRIAEGLVFPSRCLEGAPLVYVEALSVGLPVAALTTNVVSDAVIRDGSGVRLEWKSDFLVGLREVSTRRAELALNAEKAFRARYTQDAHITQIEAIYAEAMDAASQRVGRSGR